MIKPGLKAGGQSLPALVVSCNAINENLEMVIVCPLIEDMQISESQEGMVVVPKEVIGLNHNSVILCFQLFTISKERIVKRIGSLPTFLMPSVQSSLKAVLNLND